LLWALLFLFTYMTQPLLCSMVGATDKTFRKWAMPIVQSIRALAPSVVSVLLMSCIKKSIEELLTIYSTIVSD
jgi:hypothetical protein